MKAKLSLGYRAWSEPRKQNMQARGLLEDAD